MTFMAVFMITVSTWGGIMPGEGANDTANPISNTLKWTTASEVDNFGFDVYRSEKEDGPFKKITSKPITGAGTVDTPQNYKFTDTEIEEGKVYFYYVESISMKGNRKQFTPLIKSKPKFQKKAS